MFHKLPFCLTNAPAAVVTLMDQVIHNLSSCALAYIDDILIFTKTNIHDHTTHIRKVFDRHREHKIKFKISKCDFAFAEINFMGHKIS